jgi:hypothetical protein
MFLINTLFPSSAIKMKTSQPRRTTSSLTSRHFIPLSVIFEVLTLVSRRRGSSVSIVSGYGLDDRGDRGGKGFFLQPLCPDQL